MGPGRSVYQIYRVFAQPEVIARLADCLFRAWYHHRFAAILEYADALMCALSIGYENTLYNFSHVFSAPTCEDPAGQV